MQLFFQGISALDRSLRPPPNRYICPLCRELYWLHELTLEHVPPKAIGGRALCLTCKTCNSRGGHDLDAAISAERNIAGLLDASGKSHDVKMVAQGAQANVVFKRSDSGISIEVQGHRNDPRAIAELQARLREAGEFKLTRSERFTRRQVDVAHLRAAFLVAFAKFGYCYILRPELEPIRQQVKRPRTTDLPFCRMHLGQDAPHGCFLLRVTKPMDCLGVVIDSALVLLPWAGTTVAEIQTWLQADRATGRPIAVSGTRPWPWPHTSEFVSDFL